VLSRVGRVLRHQAASRGADGVVAELLKAGAQPSMRREHGETALHLVGGAAPTRPPRPAWGANAARRACDRAAAIGMPMTMEPEQKRRGISATAGGNRAGAIGMPMTRTDDGA
jgi:hypothetical protein